jgi:hypothetical protein
MEIIHISLGSMIIMHTNPPRKMKHRKMTPTSHSPHPFGINTTVNRSHQMILQFYIGKKAIMYTTQERLLKSPSKWLMKMLQYLQFILVILLITGTLG